MAPISCREVSSQLPSLPHRGTAATTTHTQISFRRAQSRRGQVTTSGRSVQLPSAATRDDAVASLVGQLEHRGAKAEYEDEDDAPSSLRRRGARKHEKDELAARWREIHGQDDWTGLLDPMDPLLRSELIRYGELAQACYDAFDYDLSSRYCGRCKYPRRAFFDRLGMPDAARGYAVTRYLYATSNFRFPNFFSPQKKTRADAKVWSQRANWIGYVAVSTDAESARLGRRDVAIAWRGTITRLEWVSDLMDYLRPVADEGIPCPDREVKVESGFVDLYTDKDPSCRFCKYSAREQVLLEVRKQIGRAHV